MAINPEVSIQFDISKLGQEGLEKLFQIEKLFAELGIIFDTGGGCGGRDWEWDYSLSGPVKVYLVDDELLDLIDKGRKHGNL
jgi:hypothetical protein